jgi:hypothetical protein
MLRAQYLCVEQTFAIHVAMQMHVLVMFAGPRALVDV